MEFTHTRAAAGQHSAVPPGIRGTAVVLGLAWLPLAVAETLLGDLDALPDVLTVAGGSDRIATAGLLHIVTGVLLAIAAVGLWTRSGSQLARRVTAVAVLVVSVCLGAFGMLHLLTLETAADGLDPVAMNAFLDRLSDAPGWWSVPVAVVGLLGAPVLAVTCLVLARAGAVRWWGPGLVSAAAVAHFAVASGVVEIAAQWALAVGLAVVAVELFRTPEGVPPHIGS
jgi:hypothetical protein